jgi:glycosyltransferase involved in cell wall biosynthesis
MRVGLLIYGSLDACSGGFEYDRRLVEHLRRSGDDVEVISLPWRSYPALLAQNFSPILFRIARTHRFDLLLQDELNHPSLFLANPTLKKRIGCPVICLVHHLRCREPHPDMRRRFYCRVERQYLRTVDAFVFNSRSTQRSVAALIGSLPEFVIATPGGDRLGAMADEKQIVDRVLADGPLRLLFIGNLVPRKGLLELLTALEKIRKDPWRLEVVGAGDFDAGYAARIRRRLHAARLRNRVRVRGTLPDVDLRQLLRTCHVLVMPFAYEGFGIVFLEAMAYGLPSLVLREGGAAEIVRDGREGYCFEPGDTSTVAARLHRLIHDRHELLRLSLSARRRFDSFPGWDRTVANIRRFLLGRVPGSRA